MKGNYKNKKTGLPDLYRYLQNKMSGKERNAFERELQKDPFKDEAFEGFSEILPEEAEADLAGLEREISSRSSRRQKLLYFRIAASVAVLMILSSVYLFIERGRPSDEPVIFSTNKVPLNITESKSIKEPQPVKQKEKLAEIEKKSEIKTVTPAVTESPGEEITAEMRAPVAAKKEDITAREETNADELVVAEEQMVAAAAPADRKVFAETNRMKSASDTVAEKMSQLMAVGYGAEKRSRVADAGAAGKTENVNASYSQPVPLKGMKSFDNYLEKNIRKPLNFTAGQKIDVIISFIVRKTGTIDSIKVISSPGAEFSEEAIRLIKDGPAWSPAVRNGETIDDEVRFKIVFK